MKHEPEPTATELLLAAAALCGSAGISLYLIYWLVSAAS
jgi:hypothetical protein